MTSVVPKEQKDSGLYRLLKKGCFWKFPHFELRKFNNLQAHFYKIRLFSAACLAPAAVSS